MSDIQYIEPIQEEALFEDVCQIIDGARGRIATYINTEVCLTNWFVGKREHHGSGWSEKTLRHCLRSAETFSEKEILYATRTQLSWTHLRTLMGIKDPIERQFYAPICSPEYCREHYSKNQNDED